MCASLHQNQKFKNGDGLIVPVFGKKVNTFSSFVRVIFVFSPSPDLRYNWGAA
jgi:hypothetical protein